VCMGDQPSTNEWLECDARRRLFYGKLLKYGLADAHLSDFYKKRGKRSGLRHWRKHGLPASFALFGYIVSCICGTLESPSIGLILIPLTALRLKTRSGRAIADNSRKPLVDQGASDFSKSENSGAVCQSRTQREERAI
jgi:hypothetical protein